MPRIEEILYYMRGIFLLLKYDPAGFYRLDLSERGFKRSFYALAICFPLMLPNWIWWRELFAYFGPKDSQTGLLFFFRMALVEYTLWFVPLLAIGLFLWLKGMAYKFETAVILTNWLSVPVYVLTALIAIGELFIPAPLAFWYYVIQLQLAAVVIAQFSLFFMLMKRNWADAFGLTLASVVPSIAASIWLNGFLGLSF